ncbi:MAG TPA: 3-oxoadipate enol-lactonase [Candidatus Sulfotelmatobacter sp.]|jgi:3-oxoadipate enol-lactonase/4-carboxymuconolactone decarboxylase
MPFLATNRTRLFYRLEGREDLPVLILSHSIGTDHSMWDLQVPDLLRYFRVLRYDTRGHGASDVPAGDYTIEQLGEDVLALVEALKIEKFAFCGLSLGGTIGQWIACHAAERLTGLILANTSPRIGSLELWNKRIEAVRAGGMAAIADLAIERFFAPEFRHRSGPHVASIRSVLTGTNAGGYIGCCAALRDFDFTGQLSPIKTPTLVIVGNKDVSTPLSGNGEILVREVSGARLVELPAGHLSNIERPREFLAAMCSFLLPAPSTFAELMQAGFAVRREVLGNEHVDRATRGTTWLTADFQQLITQYAWGTIWTRPGLDLRTRRLLVLAMMAALGRWEEFRMHVSTALRGELEACDIQETLLQTAIYAGLPAANTAFHIVQEETDRLSAKETGRI